MKNSILAIGVLGVIILAGSLLGSDNENTKIKKSIYQNINQNFQIELPAGAKTYITGETYKSPDGYADSIHASFNFGSAYISVKKNLFTETTPLIPETPICSKPIQVMVLGSTTEGQLISSSEEWAENSACDKPLSAHTVYVNFCVSSSGMPYDYKLERYSEYTYTCQGSDSFYDIELVCEGPEWEGVRGQKKCIQLFNEIMSTFKVM